MPDLLSYSPIHSYGCAATGGGNTHAISATSLETLWIPPSLPRNRRRILCHYLGSFATSRTLWTKSWIRATTKPDVSSICFPNMPVSPLLSISIPYWFFGKMYRGMAAYVAFHRQQSFQDGLVCPIRGRGSPPFSPISSKLYRYYRGTLVISLEHHSCESYLVPAVGQQQSSGNFINPTEAHICSYRILQYATTAAFVIQCPAAMHRRQPLAIHHKTRSPFHLLPHHRGLASLPLQSSLLNIHNALCDLSTVFTIGWQLSKPISGPG